METPCSSEKYRILIKTDPESREVCPLYMVFRKKTIFREYTIGSEMENYTYTQLII